MNLYSKTLHHVNHKDFKKVCQRQLDEQKLVCLEKTKIEKELKEIKNISSPLKSDWRQELFSAEQNNSNRA